MCDDVLLNYGESDNQLHYETPAKKLIFRGFAIQNQWPNYFAFPINYCLSRKVYLQLDLTTGAKVTKKLTHIGNCPNIEMLFLPP